MAYTLIGELVGDDPGDPNFGVIVTCSATGNTVAVAGQGTGAGAVYVFERDGDDWPEQEKLMGPSGGDPAGFVLAAISDDGDRLIVGAPGTDQIFPSDTEGGTVFFYERAASVWGEVASFAGSGGSNSGLGEDTAINGAGDLAIACDQKSVVRVYEDDGMGWSDGANLGGAFNAWCVAMSNDGNYAAYSGDGGDVETFVRVAGVFEALASVTTPESPIDAILSRRNLGFSADGGRLWVSTTGQSFDTQAGWIYTRSGGGWDLEKTLIPTVDQISDGEAVFSPDGTVLFLGQQADDSNTGAAFVFRRDSGGDWAEDQKLTDGESFFGTSLAATDSLRYLFVGSAGRVFVYESEPASVSIRTKAHRT
jgi:hypothetical protein